MLYWAIVCLVASLVACLFGFGGINPVFAIPAQVLFGIFLVLFVVFLVMALLLKPPVKPGN